MVGGDRRMVLEGQRDTAVGRPPCGLDESIAAPVPRVLLAGLVLRDPPDAFGDVVLAAPVPA
jgi:hypothetical protein